MKILGIMRLNAVLVFRLVVHDLRSRCLGSMLGFVWAFIQPLVMAVILWFVVGMAFRANVIRGTPYIAWLLAGMSAWAFFADALMQATGVFCEYAFMVKKIQFRLALLPLVKIGVALTVHAFFLIIVAFVLVVTGVRLSWNWLGVFYYLFAAFVLLVGLGMITASLHVFLRDVGHIVNVLLQFGFWVTPVFWDFTMLPQHGDSILAKLLRLNPMVYIVEGYRNSLLFASPFAGGWREGVYFWGVALLMLALGVFLFRRLKPHFADVL